MTMYSNGTALTNVGNRYETSQALNVAISTPEAQLSPFSVQHFTSVAALTVNAEKV